MAVTGLNDYHTFLFVYSNTVTIVVSRTEDYHTIWGGTSIGAYGGNGIQTFAVRYGISNNSLVIDSNNRGYSDGTNSNYSGNTDGLIRIYGLV